MINQKRLYRAWLLRLWAERSNGQLVWRASLEEVTGRERMGFVNLAQLFAYLQSQIEPDRADPQADTER